MSAVKIQLDLFDSKPSPFVPEFKGHNFSKEFDQARLTTQIWQIFELMKDGKWRTLSEIAERTGHHEASISAQLRNLRKPANGNHNVMRRARGDRKRGLFEYLLVINEKAK